MSFTDIMSFFTNTFDTDSKKNFKADSDITLSVYLHSLHLIKWVYIKILTFRLKN